MMFHQPRFAWALLGVLFLLVILRGLRLDADPAQPPLRIAAFRDISAFLLETINKDYAVGLQITYVKNADEAHTRLTTQQADIVFMSYDDTLSMAIQEQYREIAAFMPIHGGLLDLCGTLDLAANKNRVGIDTDTGYARALRRYLHDRLPNPDDYRQLVWIMAGATDLRYERLRAQELDLTLLNPPFSYRPDVTRIAALSGNAVVPRYQGVVANLNTSWLGSPSHRAALAAFITIYRRVLRDLRAHPDDTMAKLVDFYGLSPPIAAAVYARLWAPDGLNATGVFDEGALAQTERIFAADTGLTVPRARTWILADPERSR
ncbi:MAG TPA: hypothetical protein VES73_13005 [Lamprocystis sp. (in: g-proteobacteria)]|nr:hypothetical protein [Lamprocystis sp. (in: g-proteobacteria)]